MGYDENQLLVDGELEIEWASRRRTRFLYVDEARWDISKVHRRASQSEVPEVGDPCKGQLYNFRSFERPPENRYEPGT